MNIATENKEERVFYTYLHCKPDATPFYVGKGFGGRAFNLVRRRNPFHQNIVAKYGKNKILVFVFQCETEAQALADEVHQIAQLTSDGYVLVNQTSGGDGVANPTLSVRKKMAVGQKGKVRPPAHCANLAAAFSGRTLPESHCLNMSVAVTRRYKNPAERIKTGIAVKIACAKPEEKKRRSAASKKMWESKDYRAKKVVELRLSNPKADKCSWAKLTNSDVIAIRAARAIGTSLIEVANKYGVSIASVSGIANRRTWKSVP